MYNERVSRFMSNLYAATINIAGIQTDETLIEKYKRKWDVIPFMWNIIMQKKKNKKKKWNTFDSNLRYSICIISLSTVRLCDKYEEF